MDSASTAQARQSKSTFAVASARSTERVVLGGCCINRERVVMHHERHHESITHDAATLAVSIMTIDLSFEISVDLLFICF